VATRTGSTVDRIIAVNQTVVFGTKLAAEHDVRKGGGLDRNISRSWVVGGAAATRLLCLEGAVRIYTKAAAGRYGQAGRAGQLGEFGLIHAAG